jgi:putative selenate reductase
VLGYNEQQARTEAARCLDCHRFCSLCVSVCPNLALQTWQSDPIEVCLPDLRLGSEGISMQPGGTWSVKQAYQIAVMTDFCNECGNCTTFCPTSGEPYRDKPRLYLDRAEFEAQQDNAFMVFRDTGSWAMESRWRSQTHRIELDGKLEYRGPLFSASLDPRTFAVRHAEVTTAARSGDRLSLEPAATMLVLLNGLRKSLPHLPTALPAEVANTGRIAHPGYPE